MSDNYYIGVVLMGVSSVLWFLPVILSGSWRQWRTWEGVKAAAVAVRKPFEKRMQRAALVFAAVGIYLALH